MRPRRSGAGNVAGFSSTPDQATDDTAERSMTRRPVRRVAAGCILNHSRSILRTRNAEPGPAYDPSHWRGGGQDSEEDPNGEADRGRQSTIHGE